MSFQKIQILKAHKEKRTFPKNIKEEEKIFFLKEIIRSYQDIYIERYSNLYFINNLFLDNNFKTIKRKSMKYRYFLKSILNYGLQIFLDKDFYKYLIYRFYLVLNNVRRLFLPLKEIEDCFWITDDVNWTNYFHWLTDFIPKIILYGDRYPSRTLLMSKRFMNNAPNFVIESLELAEIPFLVLENNVKYKIANIDLIPRLAPTGNQRSELLKGIASHFRTNLSVKNKERRRIYVSRKEVNNFPKYNKRMISNESDFLDILESFNISLITLSGMSLEKQINLFSECDLLISIHGAGLTNMLWMDKGSNIIEIRQKNPSNDNCYFSMSSSLSHNYYYLQAEKEGNPNNFQDQELKLEPSDLLNLLKKIL